MPNITITITDTQFAALTAEATTRSTPTAPMTANSLAAFVFGAACDSYAASQLAAVHAAMIKNQPLVAVFQQAQVLPQASQNALIAAAQASIASLTTPSTTTTTTP